ncbi:MAG TPA: hypothetical protein VK063_11365 [Beutenbergiaceae bacterium]|nr:hypothetical protein [Beutenbergiaceae bacterium]
MLVVTWCILGACLLLAGWAGIRALRDKPVIFVQLIAAGVVVVGIVAQMVLAAVGIGSGQASPDPWLLWGYLITALVLLPAAAWWAVLDRTKWSSVVLVVAAFAIAAMQLRIWQIWVLGE